MRNIGVDLHKNNFQVCYLEGESSHFATYSIHGLDAFKKSLNKDDRLAVESTALFYKSDQRLCRAGCGGKSASV